jgi:hypothetical protein
VLEEVQPFAFFSVTVYVVVADGVTVGLALVEVNPVGLLVQLYVLPDTAVPPMDAEEPFVMVWPVPAFAAGKAFTPMATLFVAVQLLLFVSVT